MTIIKHIHRIIAAAAVGVLVATASATPQQEMRFTPDQKLRYAAAIIENYYVDSVNSDTIVQEAIVAMLKTLDPHSVYTNPKETEEATQPLDGKFSGIGVQFTVVRDTVVVVQTTQGGPSQKVGVMPGDRIIYVNDTIFTKPKMSNNDVLKTLRGPKGTPVTLKVKRGDSPELIEFRLIRDEIPIYSIDASYMVTPQTGYVRLSRFAEDTPNEFARAVDKLKKKGMRNLIIDLEDNGGGYLGAAYGVASALLEPGDLVVYTQSDNGKIPTSKLYVEEKGISGIDRVAVMVNQYSASSSEILSGAIQDQDRGVVVGRRTFGKGLVQRPFPFPDGSMIRLTTSRYYTPAGRCIQKHYDKGHGEEYHLDMLNRYKHGELFSADSIKFDPAQKCYTLKKHRTVYGGGGIMPDKFVPADTSYYSVYYRDLVAKGVINKYVTDYIEKNRDTLLKKYRNADKFFENFDVTPLMAGLIAAGEADSVKYNAEQMETSRPVLEGMLKGLLERDLYEDGIYMRNVNRLNPVFNETLRIIEDPEAYNALLAPPRKEEE